MSNTIVIFGASGDLTSRKLIPALYQLHHKQRLPTDTRIVGMSRTSLSDEAWRESLAESTAMHVGDDFSADSWQSFGRQIFYHRGDVTETESFRDLGRRLDSLEGEDGASRIYYLSTSPKLYGRAAGCLGEAGLADESHGSRRIVVEKPFGTDLPSARSLNEELQQVFQESQIYRIDHYLGKETVQNIFVLRFANSIFEPIWNRNYIDHVQITVAEEVDVGSRGGYYDSSGVLRDMFQNHLLQLMMVTAMEAPVRYEADLVRDEKVKILRSIRRMSEAELATHSVRGQYEGYRGEEDVSEDSMTATFAACELKIDNWRWNGVPFFLRSGKAMSCRTTQIVIQFREPPQLLFSDDSLRHVDANRLVIQIQPAEGIQLHFQTKAPDSHMRLRTTDLDFRFNREFFRAASDAYQRLLLDVLNGDASLFARRDEVELAWSIIDPILACWQSTSAPPLDFYPRGQWGPTRCNQWLREQNRNWFDVCPVLH